MGVRVNWQNAINTNSGGRDLDTIYLTGAGYVDYPFKGIARDSAMGWEETAWGGDLTRSTDFVLTNIDDVDFGLVERLEVSYKYMNVQDYVVLNKIATQRVCYATHFNRQKGEWVERQEMAFTGNELDKLHTYGPKYLGQVGVKIKLVATNRDRADIIGSSYQIVLNANGGIDNRTVKPEQNKQFRWSSSFKLPASGFTRSGYTLAGWNTNANGSGGAYLPGQSITVWEGMTFYAQWRANGG